MSEIIIYSNEQCPYCKQVKDRLDKLRGGLYIREYPAGQATVNTIHAHLEKCIW